jgi:hypothetical protein
MFCLFPLLTLSACNATPTPVDTVGMESPLPVQAGSVDSSFAFPMLWDDASKTAIDVSSLNPAPISEQTRLSIKNGHYFDSTNRRVRFVGINIGAGDAFPTKAEAEKTAAHLHKMGINLARLHHMDASWAKPNLFHFEGNSYGKPTLKLDKDSLDRLDYFVAQLKKNGIYIDLNLHVSRDWRKENGFVDGDKLPELGKIVSYFHPRAIELQKQFARDMLSRTNPYTKTRYADDPVFAFIEMTNEDSLLGGWFGNLTQLPDSYKSILKTQWNVYLKGKYKNTAGVKAAWLKGGEALGKNLIANPRLEKQLEGWSKEFQGEATYNVSVEGVDGQTNAPAGKALHFSQIKTDNTDWHMQYHWTGLNLKKGQRYTVTFAAKASAPRSVKVGARFDRAPWSFSGLDAGVELTSNWKRYTISFVASEVDPDHCRLSFTFGDNAADFYLADLSIQTGGGGSSMEPNETIENASFGLRTMSADPAGNDFTSFLMSIEEAYVNQMRSVIKDEMKSKAALFCSQASYGGLAGVYRESKLDHIDTHSYWQHPSFPGRGFDPENYRIDNTSMVRQKGLGTLAELNMHRVAGKPFTVSEYDHPAPSEYAAEMVPVIFSYAAWQDWDGIMLFAYGSVKNSDKLQSFFDNTNHPGKLGLVPWATALFLRGDLTPTTAKMTLTIPQSRAGEMKNKGGDFGFWNLDTNAKPDFWLRQPSIAFTSAAEPKVTETGTIPSNLPITWDHEAGTYTINTPKSQAVIGNITGKAFTAGRLTTTIAKTPRNYGVVTLTEMPSGSLVLTALDKAENPKMQWNEARTFAPKTWANGPVEVYGLSGEIAISGVVGKKGLKVYALDNTGKRKGEVKSTQANGALKFNISPADKTMWYEIEK